MNARSKTVCFVTTSPLIVNFFLVPLLRAMAGRYDVSLAVNAAEGVPLPADLPARVHSVRILRPIAPLADLAALWTLYSLFRAERFAAVHSVSPKGGLLAMTAAWLARVPTRVHMFTGQVWVTRRGPSAVAAEIDRSLDCRGGDARAGRQSVATRLSRRAGCRQRGAMRGTRLRIDQRRRYRAVQAGYGARAEVRAELGLDASVPLFLFLGRINRDKGALDLAAAFQQVHSQAPDVALLFVGPDEDGLQRTVLDAAGAGAAVVSIRRLHAHARALPCRGRRALPAQLPRRIRQRRDRGRRDRHPERGLAHLRHHRRNRRRRDRVAARVGRRRRHRGEALDARDGSGPAPENG
ncbi:MAG: glycosyltransferase family 4 protein [Gammaproteobacteria bacterium]|nr:glycosyltransferase family 4 protein [Gammaproteobacteria bacterium]